MIVGIGTDLVEIARIERAYRRQPERFVQRLLHPEERAAFAQVTTPGPWLAKRWAAKEALGKALGTGIRPPLRLASICVTRGELGQPLLTVSAEAEPLLTARGVRRMHVSLSDERGYALAFVLLEG